MWWTSGIEGRTRTGVVGIVGVALGLGLGAACAGKNKASRSPAQCMTECEQEQCSYDANALGNDAYLECLEACEGRCAP